MLSNGLLFSVRALTPLVHGPGGAHVFREGGTRRVDHRVVVGLRHDVPFGALADEVARGLLHQPGLEVLEVPQAVVLQRVGQVAALILDRLAGPAIQSFELPRWRLRRLFLRARVHHDGQRGVVHRVCGDGARDRLRLPSFRQFRVRRFP